MEAGIKPGGGGRIRIIRTILELRQKPFADKIGISENLITQLENDKKPLTKKTISLILKAFPNVRNDFLIEGKGEPLDSTEWVITNNDGGGIYQANAEQIARMRIELDEQKQQLQMCIRAINDLNRQLNELKINHE